LSCATSIWKKSCLGLIARLFLKVRGTVLTRVPNRAILRRVIPATQRKPTGEIKSSFFKDSNGLSADLALFSSLRETITGHKTPPRWPEYIGYAEFSARDIRRSSSTKTPGKPPLDVLHAPLKDSDSSNYSHASTQRKLTQGEINVFRAKAKFFLENNLPPSLWPRPF